MSEPDGIPVARPLREKARRWEEAWGLPGLLNSVTVEFSTRMRVSLGLCRPVEGRIRLAAGLRNGNAHLLEEVLCHELAHARRFTFFPMDGSYWGSDVPTGAFRADGCRYGPLPSGKAAPSGWIFPR